MEERLAKAELVFSRAKAARERRLRREMEPTAEPEKLFGVLVLSLLFVVVVVVVSLAVEVLLLLSVVTVVLDCGGTVTAEAVAVDKDEAAEEELGR